MFSWFRRISETLELNFSYPDGKFIFLVLRIHFGGFSNKILSKFYWETR